MFGVIGLIILGLCGCSLGRKSISEEAYNDHIDNYAEVLCGANIDSQNLRKTPKKQFITKNNNDAKLVTVTFEVDCTTNKIKECELTDKKGKLKIASITGKSIEGKSGNFQVNGMPDNSPKKCQMTCNYGSYPEIDCGL